MKLVKAFLNKEEYSDMLKFYCLACKESHIVCVGKKSYWRQIWTFNNDYNKPTINPSILVSVNYPNYTSICHSFIKEGKIQYLNDCTHNMKGTTIELLDIDENENLVQ